MEISDRYAVGSGRLFIILMTASFILFERLFGHFIPKDFHPAATTAMGTAIVWWLIALIVDRSRHGESPVTVTVGMTTGCFFLSLAGLLIGIGESGCTAWMLTAPLITGSLGLLWWWVMDAYFGLDRMSSPAHAISIRNTRIALIKVALVIYLLLAPIAVKLNW